MEKFRIWLNVVSVDDVGSSRSMRVVNDASILHRFLSVSLFSFHDVLLRVLRLFAGINSTRKPRDEFSLCVYNVTTKLEDAVTLTRVHQFWRILCLGFMTTLHLMIYGDLTFDLLNLK